MKIKDTFIVMKAEKKNGTTNDGRSWERTEYLLKNVLAGNLMANLCIL